MSRTLVLWDVDMTLVDYRGVGRDWYLRALATVGVELTSIPHFAGRTERALTMELLDLHGLPRSEEHVQRVFAELIAVAGATRHTFAGIARVLPGAAGVLASVAARPDVVQSLVTGNLPELADYKLTPFGLVDHLDLAVGGYGAKSEHRHDLVADAMELAAAKYDRRFPAESVVVVGDTPLDIEAARHHGAVAIGVATGMFGAGELADAGADLVLADLSDVDTVVAALLG